MYLNISEQKKRLICMTVFILFFGTRNLTGWDWQSYYPMFRSLPLIYNLDTDSIFVFDGSSIIEPGFTVYMSLLKTICLENWELFMIVSTCIDCLLLDTIFKRYSSNYVFSFLIFLCLCLGTEIDLLRNMKALLLFYYAIKYIESQQILKYYIIVLLAITVHYSAVLFLILYPLGHLKARKNIITLIIISSVIIFLVHIPLMSYIVGLLGDSLGDVVGSKLSNYASSQFVRGITLGFVFKSINSALIIWKFNDIKEYNNRLSIFLWLYALMIFVTFGMNDISGISERIEDLFTPVCCILFPALIHTIKVNTNKLLCGSYIFMYLLLKLSSDTHMVMYNYQSFIYSSVNFKNKEIEYGNYANQIMNKNR